MNQENALEYQIDRLKLLLREDNLQSSVAMGNLYYLAGEIRTCIEDLHPFLKKFVKP